MPMVLRTDTGSTLAVDVFAVEANLTGDVGAGDNLVHAVERAQHGGLATAGGADEGGNGARRHVQADVLHRVEIAVVDVDVFQIQALGHCGTFLIYDAGKDARLYFLTENLEEMMRATMLIAAMMSTRVSAAPHILSKAAPVLPALYMSSMNSGRED